jgi:hypothetical protein
MTIYEPRLQAQLGVEHFRLPPAEVRPDGQQDVVEKRYTVPCVRFPEWHECPKCHRLGHEGAPFLLADDGNRLVCQGCGAAPVNPVRFVVACARGHMEDFPWAWWAHRGRAQGVCEHPVLFLRSHGRSAALADLFVVCNACGASSSLGDAFATESLRGRRCHGSRPWLHDREPACEAAPRVVQRGASNIHFPVVASALSIPPASEPLFQLLDDHWDTLSVIPASAVDDTLAGLAERHGVPPAALLDAYRQRVALERGDASCTELALRAEEYLALATPRDDEPLAGILPQLCNRVEPAPPALARWFDLVGAVSRLREVRAVAGFSRIEPFPVSGEQIRDALRDHRIAPLSQNPQPWLPAVEIRGEGIFLRFRTDAIDHWIRENPAVNDRAAALERRSAQVAAQRGYRRDYAITPRLLLVHSFAHAMIRQLSIDCGYSSSALRERLYVAEGEGGSGEMNGVLIYTGSPDSEGSLGGLVRLADPVLLTDAVSRAVRFSRWCGSDPVCLETDPAQSGERISGAACHCCLLVPETACEKFNRELDRTMLVGDVDGRRAGFFGGLLEEGAV